MSNITNFIRIFFSILSNFKNKHYVSEAIGIRGLRTEECRFRNAMFVSEINETGKSSREFGDITCEECVKILTVFWKLYSNLIFMDNNEANEREVL